MDFSMIKLCVTLIALARLYSIVSGLKRVKTYPLRYSAECLAEPCPDFFTKQWEFLQRHCCPRGGDFHCQMMNKEKKESVRICMDSVTCPPGYYADLLSLTGATLLRETMCRVCNIYEFQPHATPSHYFTYIGCHNRSISCIDLNAFTTVLGLPFSDNTCKCSFVTGYRPVPYKGHKCIEFKSTSGCRCRHKPCPSTQVLNSEFRCEQPTLRNILEGAHVTRMDSIYLQNLKNVKEDERWEYIENLCEHIIHTFISSIAVKIIALGCFVCILFIAVIMKRENERQDDEKRNIAVRLKFNSKHISQTAFQEVKNILPLLARCYGPMSLAYNSNLKHITVLLQPGDYHFDLMVFIRDLLSSASLKDKLSTYRSDLASDVTIIVLYTLSSSLQVIDSEYSSLDSLDNLQPNSGNLRFKLMSNKDEIRIVGKLLNDRKQLTKIFLNHKLKFVNVHQGSIVVKFELQSDSGIMNSLAWETQVKAIVKDLFSTESLRNLASEHDIQVEFVCKAKLDSYQVVQAENLVIQVGCNNTVTVCCHRHSDQQNDRDENEVNDGVHYVHATGDENCMGELISLNIIQFPRTVRNNPDEIPRRDADLEANANVTKIVVNCNNVETASILRNEWHNVLTLIQNLHPGCTMRMNGSQVEWHLPITTQDGTLHFLKNIFCIEHIRSALRETSVEVAISEARGTQGRQPVGTTEGSTDQVHV